MIEGWKYTDESSLAIARDNVFQILGIPQINGFPYSTIYELLDLNFYILKNEDLIPILGQYQQYEIIPIQPIEPIQIIETNLEIPIDNQDIPLE